MSSQSLSSKFSFSSERRGRGGGRRDGEEGGEDEGSGEKFRHAGSEEVNERKGNMQKRDKG